MLKAKENCWRLKREAPRREKWREMGHCYEGNFRRVRAIRCLKRDADA